MHLDDEGLALFAEGVIAMFDGNLRKAARAYGVNPGHFTHARKGDDAPILRRTWKIAKHPQRSRLIFSAPPELIYEFHAAAQMREMSAVEYLRYLLDLDKGIGEVV